MKLATLCYVKANGRTLMMHRIKKKYDMHAGKWNGLGGKFLPGETPEQCAIRELAEESGLNVSNPHLRGILTFPAFQGAAVPPNIGEDWYTFVFVATEFTGELIDCDEGVLAWIADDELLHLNLWEGDKIFLPWLAQDAFFSGQFIYVDGKLSEHSVVFYTSQGIKQGSQLHGEQTAQALDAQPEPAFQPVYQPTDDTYCWMCNGPVVKRHCKIACQICGFTRDCSDP